MAPPWDVFGVGAAMGGAVGLIGGYHLRKLVVRVQSWRVNRRKVGIDTETTGLRPDGYAPPKRSRRSTSQKPQYIPIVPNEHNGFLSDLLPQEVNNPDRDLVIAALVNSGYSKAAAVKAADACSLVERAHGLQQWTIAAFRNAHGAK